MEKPVDKLGVREMRRVLRGLAEEISKRKGRMGAEHVRASLSLLDVLSDVIEDGYDAVEVLTENGKRRGKKRKKRARITVID